MREPRPRGNGPSAAPPDSDPSPATRWSRWATRLSPTVRPAWWAAGGLALLTALIYSRQLFAHYTFPWDFSSLFTATPPFVASTIGAGHTVAWSPYVASGFPVDVNPEAGIYFPPWWVLGRLGVTLNLTVVTCVQVAQVWFGACGVLALARARRLGWSWAVLAAVAYLLFGGFYGDAEHAGYVRGFAYLPWLLWCLTPSGRERGWSRLAALPLVVWLIASGAYPAQVVSFAMVSAVYLAVGWRQSLARERLVPLCLAVAASVLVCLAVLYPYLLAGHLHQLARVEPPTAAVRAQHSLGTTDVFGLYLNSFAWHADGSTTSWSLAVPVLVGLALLTGNVLRRQLPLVAAGLVALLLASAPKVAPIGHAMAALGGLFPSRFPAGDYKSVVALSLVVVSADAWATFARRPTPSRRPIVLGAGLLLAGALIAPAPHAPLTRFPGLLPAVVLATVAVGFIRPRPAVLALTLVALIAVDGGREAISYAAADATSAWAAPPSSVGLYRARDTYISQLPALLRRTPVTRPARVPPANPRFGPAGDGPDASGWVADGYHVISYGGTVERVLAEAWSNPLWLRLLEQPWHAFLFPCPTSGCHPPRAGLPPAPQWHVGQGVSTTAYGNDAITYTVHLPRPALMVENELANPGWRADSVQARPFDTRTPFRGWQLAAGTYRFTARYHPPGRLVQASAAGLALLAWIVLVALVAERQALPWRPTRVGRDGDQGSSAIRCSK